MDNKPPKFISEKEKLAIALNRTHTERFYLRMRLIKISQKLKSAKIRDK